MFRRNFIQRFTLAGASGLASVPLAKAAGDSGVTERRVLYRIKGFTCVTCAFGLEVMLKQQEGILGAKASYEGASVAIRFDSHQINKKSIQEFIQSKGFTPEENS